MEFQIDRLHVDHNQLNTVVYDRTAQTFGVLVDVYHYSEKSKFNLYEVEHADGTKHTRLAHEVEFKPVRHFIMIDQEVTA
jgi:hypothetical protein